MAWNISNKDEHLQFIERDKPKIGICVPHQDKVSMYWVERAYGPLRFKPLSWCTKKPYLSSGPPIDIARNELVTQALNDECDYIFFLDSDVTPRYPQDINLALYHLWSLQVPLVSGLYRAKKKYGQYWAVWTKIVEEGMGYQPLVDFDNPILPADIAGLGCTLVHREVFEAMPQPWFLWEDMHSYSEDFYFFRKAKEYGYQLVINGDVRMDHLGNFMITGHKDKAKTFIASDCFGDLHDDE